MPMSQYIRDPRAQIGTSLLEVPTVSVLTFDDAALPRRRLRPRPGHTFPEGYLGASGWLARQSSGRAGPGLAPRKSDA